MNKIIKQIYDTAKNFPEKIALKSGNSEISYLELCFQIDKISNYLKEQNHKVVATLCSNCVEWIIIDLACLKLEICFIAIPHFFSEKQMESLIKSAKPSIVIFNDKSFSKRLTYNYNIFLGSCQEKSKIFGFDDFFAIESLIKNQNILEIDEKCVKITYTSGSSGEPKGVCLSVKQIENVVFALQKRVGIANIEKHFSILPLSILLENIAGVYLALTSEAFAVILDTKEIGFKDSSSIDINKLASSLEKYKPTSFILVPEIAKVVISLVKMDKISSKKWRFIAVGGAKIAKGFIDEAISLNIPLYQGYGLSEFASVVSLNSADDNKSGSVGKVLPHIDIKINEDGEILLKNNLFIGYLGKERLRDEYYETGDIGKIDDDGFLWILGRKKDFFITSFGRNVSPQWVESEFLKSDKILQIAVFGEARPSNIAVIFSSSKADVLQKEIEKINKELPDYARVSEVVYAKEKFSFENGLTTSNGRILRNNIYQLYINK